LRRAYRTYFKRRHLLHEGIEHCGVADPVEGTEKLAGMSMAIRSAMICFSLQVDTNNRYFSRLSKKRNDQSGWPVVAIVRCLSSGPAFLFPWL